MKKFKKVVLLIMCLIFVAFLACCNVDEGDTAIPNTPNQTEQGAGEENGGNENGANNNGSNGGLTLPEQGWTDVRK